MSQMSHATPLDECIRSAVELLLRREGPSFSMTTLAQRAGVSRATLYRRLRGRELAELVAAARRSPTPRERLVESASRLVAARGVDGFNLEEVAAAAGVSTSTLYREFAQRSDLLRAVVEAVAPSEGLAELLGDVDAPPRAVLPAFVAAVLRRLQEQPLFLRLVLLGDEADVAALRKLRRKHVSVSQALTSYLDAQVRAGRLRRYSAARLAGSLLGLIVGAHRVSPMVEGAPIASTEKTADELVAIYLDGAGQERVR